MERGLDVNFESYIPIRCSCGRADLYRRNIEYEKLLSEGMSKEEAGRQAFEKICCKNAVARGENFYATNPYSGDVIMGGMPIKQVQSARHHGELPRYVGNMLVKTRPLEKSGGLTAFQQALLKPKNSQPSAPIDSIWRPIFVIPQSNKKLPVTSIPVISNPLKLPTLGTITSSRTAFRPTGEETGLVFTVGGYDVKQITRTIELTPQRPRR